MKVEQNISLRKYNTFGVDCTAERLIIIESTDDLGDQHQNKSLLQTDQLILGGGSNVLFTREKIGQIILIKIPGISIIEEDNNYALVRAGAGEIWDNLVQFAIDHKLSGIENLSIIPGKCGAAPIQNIGAYGVELSEVFHSLKAFHIATGEVKDFSLPDCQFGYRDSYFKSSAKNQYIISEIILKLSKSQEVNLSYGALQDLKNNMDTRITPAKVRNEVINIRNSKLPDPSKLGNAGSFFKNPMISTSTYEELKSRNPDLPGFIQDEENVKIPAGWLIEKCGWKGKRLGAVGVHERQALVLVNLGNAKGKKIYELAMQIQSSVLNEFGIILEPEVNVV